MIGFLIEHYAGNFPLWLTPEQVRVLPIGGEDEPGALDVIGYACSIERELREHGVRATIDTSSDPIKAKIANAEQKKVHTMLVLGKRDLESGHIAVRIHGKGPQGFKPRAEVIASLLAEIAERRA